MAVMARESWTDERLDDLNVRVDCGFDRVSREVATQRAEAREDIAALRAEMRAEFSAFRAEMKEEFAAVRTEMRAEFAAVRTEMKAGHDALRAEVREGFDRIHARFDALQRSMLTAVIAVSGCMVTGFAAVFAALV